MQGMRNPFSLEGKTILVTGASSGIGQAIAIESSRMGAYLIITGRDPQRLKKTFNLLTGKGHHWVIADLQNELDLRNLISDVIMVDGVVHSAGISGHLPFAYVEKSKIEEMFQINFIVPTIISQKLIKNKKIRNGGSIVFITSISGIMMSFPGGSLYSASKGAISGMIKGMAIDLAPKKIRVNSLMPGMIETNIMKDGDITQDQLEEDKKKYLLKRYGKPEEVAYAAIYLLSDASLWVTGTNLLIDGGRTISY